MNLRFSVCIELLSHLGSSFRSGESTKSTRKEKDVKGPRLLGNRAEILPILDQHTINKNFS